VNSTTKQASLFAALIPIIFLIVLLGLNVYFFKSDSSYGANQIALLLAAAVAGFVGLKYGSNWKIIYNGIVESISSAMGAVIILLLIGALAGTWLLSGVVPAMIYCGLQVLNPTIFLVAACIICAVVSIATGSSWSTIATVGIALLGIGQVLGLSTGWIAGAIISGAYFGDKMSPLSDTTNVAPAVAGTDLFTHIRHMVWTTAPSFIISLIVFTIVGFRNTTTYDSVKVDELLALLDTTFNINAFLFLVPAAMIILIWKKMPAIPALFLGSLIGGIFALIYQPDLVARIAGDADGYIEQSYKAIITSMSVETTGYFEAENNIINEIFDVPVENRSSLLKAGGMVGMMNTVWLIICALTFGGVMQATGLLRRITEALLKLVNSVGSLIATTAGTCIFFNVTASDQYLAIVVPGKMYDQAFKDYDLAPENLSRTLEDAGTVTSVLIPWNTCGVAQSGVLGVAVLLYAPYCIFNWVSPIMTILFGYMGWKITPLKKEKLAK
jgi:NhaC family Na+:H+ antiporter